MSISTAATKKADTYSGTPAKLQDLFSHIPAKYYDEGQIFMFPGDYVTQVHYIESGLVRVYDISQSGNEVVVNVFRKGDVFPMSKALNHTYNHYFYQAIGPLSTRQVSTGALEDFLLENPQITLDLLAASYLAAQVMRRRMAHLMGGSATNRLIYELVIQAKSEGRHRSDDSYLIPMSEGEIGARSGLSRETVSRELRKFKATDLIMITSGGILLRNVKKLESMLGSFL
jgi:CRP-like cAMP-binding protein